MQATRPLLAGGGSIFISTECNMREHVNLTATF